MRDAGNRLTHPPALSGQKKSAHLQPWPAACRRARSNESARETIITIKNKSERQAAIKAREWRLEAETPAVFSPRTLTHTLTLADLPPTTALSPPRWLPLARPPGRCAMEADPQWHHPWAPGDWDRHPIESTVLLVRQRWRGEHGTFHEPVTCCWVTARPRMLQVPQNDHRTLLITKE